METLNLIYPYTLIVLYVLSAIAFVLLLVLLFKVLKALKALKTTLTPVDSIKTRVNTIQSETNHLKKFIKDKKDSFKQFTKKLGLILTAWHILFPRKEKK